MSGKQSVSKNFAKAINVQVIDFTSITLYESKIRVGANEWGLLVTPVNDVIGMSTGQSNDNCNRTWANLADYKKKELQEDLVDTNGML